MRFGPTLFWAAMAVVSAVAMYRVKDAVTGLEEELATVDRQIVQTRERIHVLQAEWAHLNSPARLADLAERHLGMVPANSDMRSRIDDLPPRLLTPGPESDIGPARDASSNGAPGEEGETRQ